MKRVIGIACILSGIFIIGVGSYCAFELYDRYLVSTSVSIYEGKYIYDSRTIDVKGSSNDSLNITIDGNSYKFAYDGEVFRTNDDSKYIINFTDNGLILFINNQQEGINFEKIKN